MTFEMIPFSSVIVTRKQIYLRISYKQLIFICLNLFSQFPNAFCTSKSPKSYSKLGRGDDYVPLH